MDVTKYFGTTSGGIKTYILEKARYVADRPGLRHLLVAPGAEDQVVSREGARSYFLRGPRIPAHPPYRFLLATRSLQRVIEHERPDLIEVGSPFFVPWLTRFANRRLQAPMIWYYHSHLPQLVSSDPRATTPVGSLAIRAMERYVRVLGDQFPVVICGSRFSAGALGNLGVQSIALVPLGVDLEHFHPRRRSWASATRSLHQLPDGPLALYTGRLATEKRIDVVLNDEARDIIVHEGFDPAYGARPLKRAIQRLVLDPLAVKVLEGAFHEGDTILVSGTNGQLTFEAHPELIEERPPQGTTPTEQ